MPQQNFALDHSEGPPQPRYALRAGQAGMKARVLVAVVLSLAGVAYAADPRLPYVVSTLAGTPGEAGLENGNAATAKFNRPTWLDVVAHATPYEGIDDGDIFVVDRANQVQIGRASCRERVLRLV